MASNASYRPPGPTSPPSTLLNNQRQIPPQASRLVAPAAAAAAPAAGVIHRRHNNLGPNHNPDYTEFGIKIHKLRLTLKVQRRASSCSANRGGLNNGGGSGSVNVDPGHLDRNGRPRLGSEDRSRVARARQQQQQQQQQPLRHQRARRRPRPTSTTSSLVDSLRNLDLDPEAGSRRPVVQDSVDGAAISNNSGGGTRVANWEFQGFYSPPIRTSTPSSGYSSTAVSRTSSFSSDFFGVSSNPNGNNSSNNNSRSRHHSVRLSSQEEDSAYSEVYSTIEELSELPDPFDGDEQGNVATMRARDRLSGAAGNSKSLSSLLHDSGCLTLRAAGASTSPSSPPLHQKTHSSAGVLEESGGRATDAAPASTRRKASSHGSRLDVTGVPLPLDMAPPLPPRSSKCRPPARPPYPSSSVAATRSQEMQ